MWYTNNEFGGKGDVMDRDFTIGRNDFSVTVYVPWNCTNNCKFCSSKKDYNIIKSDFNCVKEQLYRIRKSIVPIVVFTGGEPSVDIDKLSELVSIVDNKIVYINTTLPRRNSDKFIEFINTTDCVKGISVSRHSLTYEEDASLLNDICDDEVIAKITKPVRINVVSYKDNQFCLENVEKYVNRWKKVRKLKGDSYNSLILNLRSNYILQNKEKLHEMEDDTIINDLACKYYYYRHVFCNVCDTCVFFEMENNERTFEIDYHRGLLKTSINFGNITEINDLILLQNGEICYDWDGKKDNIDRLLQLLDM